MDRNDVVDTVAALAVRAALIGAVIGAVMLAKAAFANDAYRSYSVIRNYTGLPPVARDPELSRLAERRAQELARSGWRGKSGHNRPRGVSFEGIGKRSIVDPQGRRMLACGMNSRRYSRCGCAVAIRGGTSYYVLLYR